MWKAYGGLMTKQYTISEALELQNKRKQLEQRLQVHIERASEKQKELNEIFAKVGVSNLQEFSNLCAIKNKEMQDYAQKEEQTVQLLTERCDALDKLL